MRYALRLFMLSVVALALAACSTVGPAPEAGLEPQIKYGELDGERHPMVGLMVAFIDGAPRWRCSGTLLSPTLYLTAGHCTYGADHVEIWFDADLRDAAAHDYPFSGDVGGTPYTHPAYDPQRFFLADVGVVVLDEPYVLAEYGQLPEPNVLDQMARRRGRQDATFTAVGYGLQFINPVFVEAERVRMLARPKLIQINVPGFTGDFSLLLSNNHSTGGTCFGDSGGPNFIGDSLVVGGVTSFGINGNCAGTGGVFRMDRAVVLDWVNGFF
jgi:secreted trypsin-like serine protease